VKDRDNFAMTQIISIRDRHPKEYKVLPELNQDSVLRVLDLSFNDIVFHEETFKNLRAGIKNSNLRELNLTGNEFGAAGWRYLASALN
jgi:hypothetical protein